MARRSGSTCSNRSRIPPKPSISRPASVNSGAVALLVLLARSAPAGVVAADLVLVVLDDRLLLRDRAAAVGGLVLDRLLRCDVSSGGCRDGRLVEGRRLDGGSARVVEAADLLRRRELLRCL